MMEQAIGLIVFLVFVCGAYWLGRIDGYWIRAAEDRRIAPTQQPNDKGATE